MTRTPGNDTPLRKTHPAETLFVTPNTVRTHLDRIRDKTSARNRAELTRYAIQAGIEPVVPSP